MSALRRLVPIAGAAVAVLGLTGCGGGGAAAVDLWLGNDVVVARAVTTTTQPTAETGTETAGAAGERTTQSQQYTVQRGDSVSRIASICGVTMDALVGINEWGSADAVSINPDQVVQIPPNGYVGCNSGSSSSTGTSSSAASSSGAATSTELGKCADGSNAETYKIVQGDNPSRVARAHDISLDELRAANEGNSAMTRFNVGQELYLPC